MIPGHLPDVFHGIGEEMNNAMMDYMPLRTRISFSGGALDHEALRQVLAQMNG